MAKYNYGCILVVLEGITVGSKALKGESEEEKEDEQDIMEIDTEEDIESDSDDEDDHKYSELEVSSDEEEERQQNEVTSDESESEGKNVLETKASEKSALEPVTTGTKYIPPRLRAQMAGQESDDLRLMKVHKLVQGQINRLSESNMESIINEIESIYLRFPRADVNNVLTKIIIQSVKSRIHMLDTFLYINAAFVSAIYRIICLEAGMFIIDKSQIIITTICTKYI